MVLKDLVEIKIFIFNSKNAKTYKKHFETFKHLNPLNSSK